MKISPFYQSPSHNVAYEVARKKANYFYLTRDEIHGNYYMSYVINAQYIPRNLSNPYVTPLAQQRSKSLIPSFRAKRVS